MVQFLTLDFQIYPNDGHLGRLHDSTEQVSQKAESIDKWRFLKSKTKKLDHRVVQKTEGVSFRRAADIPLEISGMLPGFQTIKIHTGTKHPILVNPDKSLADKDLMSHVIDFYHRAFLNDPKAMKYLESCHCMHPEAVKRFRIGYANKTLGYRVPATTAGGKQLKARLKKRSLRTRHDRAFKD